MQRIALLFDRLVGKREQRRRRRKAEDLRSLKIDDQLVLSRGLYRQIAGLFALEDTVDVGGCTPKDLRHVGAVGHQAAARGKETKRVDRWDVMARRQRDDRLAIVRHADVRQHHQAPIRFARKHIEHAIDIGGVAHGGPGVSYAATPTASASPAWTTQSALMPADVMTFVHFSLSARQNLAKSSAEPIFGFALNLARLASTSGDRKNSFIDVL